MNRTVKNVALITAVSVLSACATKPENINASYVSPLTYDNYDCKTLSHEATRISNRAAEAAGVQSKKATRDAVATGVGIVVFWPALFFIKGNGASEAEVARLKGEMKAVEQVSTKKGCGIKFSSGA